MVNLLPIIISFFICLFLLIFFRLVAFKIKLIDRPSKRKKHKNNVPLVGGISMSLGFSVGMIIVLNTFSYFEYYYFLSALLALTILGMVDDY